MRTFSPNPLFLTERLYEAIQSAHWRIADYVLSYAEPFDKGNYLDIATDGQISWRPLNRMDDVIAGRVSPYDTKGRMRGKPAKTIKAFLGHHGEYYFNDKDWESFSNRFLATQTEATLEMVDGKDIAKFYLADNYTRTKHVAPLASSCMRYSHCQPYLDLYVKNKDKVQMLVQLDNSGMVEARALVWKFDQGETFMDRIYGDNNAVEVFRKYALDNGWWYRTNNSYVHPLMMMVDGQSRRRTRRVTLDHTPDLFPFCDTMLWLSLDEGVLSNSKASLKRMGNVVELRHTNGRFMR